MLGTSNYDIPDSIKKRKAWTKAASWIQDKTKFATKWKVEVKKPDEKEITKAVFMCKSDKGVNRD